MSAVERARWSTLAGFVVLVSLIVVGVLSVRSGASAVVWAALASLPLWAVLVPLFKGNRRAYAAGTLCLVPYLVVGLTELVVNPAARAWASAVLLTAFLTFVSVIVYLRLTRGASMGA